MAVENLSPTEITDLCDHAEAAWNNLGPRSRKANFKWRDKSYIAVHTSFRLLVQTPSGQPVADRLS